MHDVIIWRRNFFRPWSRDSDLWVYGYVNGAPHWTFLQGGKKSHVDSTFGDSTSICFPFNFQTLQHWCRQRPPGHHSIYKRNPLHTSYPGFELNFFENKFLFFSLWSRFSFDALLTVSLQNKQLIFSGKDSFFIQKFFNLP